MIATPPLSDIYTPISDSQYSKRKLLSKTESCSFSRTTLSLFLSGLFAFSGAIFAEDIPVDAISDFQTTIRSDTNYLIQSDITTGNLSFTVFNGIDLSLTGSKNDGSAVVIQATDMPSGTLLDLDVYNSNVRLEGLDLRGGTGTQSAVLFNTASSHYEKTLTLGVSNFSVSDFNAGDKSVIMTDPNSQSGNTEPVWFDRLEMNNVVLKNNSGAYVLNFRNGANIAALSKVTALNNKTTGSALYLDLAGGDITGLTASGNTVGNYVASFAYNRFLPDSATASAQSGIFTLNKASVMGNTATKSQTSGMLSVTGFKSATIQNSSFEGNEGGQFTSYFSGNDSLTVQNVFFSNNTSSTGAMTLVSPEGSTSKATFHNISATGNDASSTSDRYGKVLSIYGQFEDCGASADIILSNDQKLTWQNASDSDNEKTSAISAVFGSQNRTVNLEVQTNADFSSDLGIHASKYRSTWTANGQLKVTKTGSATLTLGGESHFEVDTLFDVTEGSFSLSDNAKLIWYRQDTTPSQDRSFFALRSNTKFNVGLYDITEQETTAHGDYAPLSLANNHLLLEEGSTVDVRILNADEALSHAGESSWLILAENASLNDKGAALNFATMENWIFSFDEESGGIQQGITDTEGNLVAGTEDNVYIGYSLRSTITPDESASSITSATSHFAFSSLETISDGLFHWRPDHSDALWVRPTYIHDRRTPGATVGFDANLRGFTAGKDFRTENGFWGAAVGYGSGALHSLGSAAYTSGDLKSAWAALYGEHRRDRMQYRALLAYLHQNADQDQMNNAAELHTDTTNDVILARLSAAYEYTLSEDVSKKTTFAPEIGLQYAWLNQHDFDVNLQGGTELLHGEEESMSIFSVPVKGTLRHDWLGKDTTRHNVALSLGGEVTLSDLDMKGRFQDFRGRNAGEWTLVALDRWQAEATLAYTLYDRKNAMTLTLGGGYIYGENREQTEAHAVVRWLW